MSTYSKALAAFLEGGNQTDLADKVGCTQAAISRYKSGARLPPRKIAEKIEEQTNGAVSLESWIAAAAEKFGLAA